MRARTPCRPTVIGILLALVLVLGVIDSVDAQAPAPDTAAEATGDGQPQLKSTGGGTFQKSIGYFMVALLVAGSLYAVCRTSRRT